MSKTAAILCIARNELPFTNEWVEYHLKLGIDRIYYVSTDPEFDHVQRFFRTSEFQSRVELLHFNEFRPGWQIRCYNEILPLIHEDWILVIDIDEFLCLHSHSTIQEFLATFADDTGQIQFPWLISMSKDYCHQRVFDIVETSGKYVSDHVKSMVLRRCATGLAIHSHNIVKLQTCLSSRTAIATQHRHSLFLEDTEYCRKHSFILHFCSRGHFDVLNRIIDHQFFNSKNGEHEKTCLMSYLSNEPDWSNIPTRYMLMQFYASLPALSMRIPLPTLESKTDISGLKAMFMKNIRRVVDFSSDDYGQLQSEFEGRYHLTSKLARQDLSKFCSLDDYRKCSSQLEYIGRLRQSLQAGNDRSQAVLPDQNG